MCRYYLLIVYFCSSNITKRQSMRRKTLIAINSFLATILAVLGFSSCNGSGGIGRVECMYGGPDMYDSTLRQRTLIDKNGDTLQITGNDTVVKAKAQEKVQDPGKRIRVMYGGPYTRYSNEEKALVK